MKYVSMETRRTSDYSRSTGRASSRFKCIPRSCQGDTRMRTEGQSIVNFHRRINLPIAGILELRSLQLVTELFREKKQFSGGLTLLIEKLAAPRVFTSYLTRAVKVFAIKNIPKFIQILSSSKLLPFA